MSNVTFCEQQCFQKSRGEAIKKLEGNFSKEAIQKIKDLNGGGAWILKTALYNSQTPKMIANIKNATAANKADLALIANFSGQANTREEARKKLEQFKGSKINWPAEVRAEQNKYIGQLLQPRGAKAEITEEKVKQIKEDYEKRLERAKAKRQANPLRSDGEDIDIDELFGQAKGCLACHK